MTKLSHGMGMQKPLGGGSLHLFGAGVLLLTMLWVGLTPVNAASFTASFDRDPITLGETVTLSLTFEGGQPATVPIPQVSGLQISQVGRSSQTTADFNGHNSSTTTILFAVAPRQVGKFTIPALTTEIDGRQVSTQPVSLTVLKADAPSAAAVNSGSELAFMKLSLPKEKIYLGQVFTAQLQICWRDDVQSFGNFQITGTPVDGFTVGKMAQGQGHRTQIGNRIYTVVPLNIVLTAVKSGKLGIGPFTASATYLVPSPNQSGTDPFFRQFFNQGEQRQISMATEELNVQSLPLPTTNAPANFNGAVGEYTMTVSAGPTNVAVGDPITVRVQIAGRGALDAIALPDQPAWHDFKSYPPTQKTEPTDQLGIEGTKTFEQIVTPENTDVHELPPFTFSFFDPNTGDYHTLTQPATPLTVHSGGTTAAPVIAAAKPAGDEKPVTPQDILPIKDQLGTLTTVNAPLVTRPGFLALQSVPMLAFLAAFVWRNRTDSLANNPRLRRQRAVAQLVASGVNDLKKYAAANQSDEFFATLIRLLQEQLGERLDCPSSAITENVIEEHPVLRGTPTTTRDGLRELFQLCNQARYAPVRGSSELNSVAAQFKKTVGELQEVKA